MCRSKIVVSEYVSYGHPDKIADQISDSILDAYLIKDKDARVAVETMVKDNIVCLGGEVHSDSRVDVDCVVRNVYKDLNFPHNHGLSPDNIKVINLIGQQSPEIHNGVDVTFNDGSSVVNAGDQGFFVGFATNETPAYLGLGHYISKCICSWINKQDGVYGPDAKSQTVVKYDNEGTAAIESILVSTMHYMDVDQVRSIIEKSIQSNAGKMFDDETFRRYIDKKRIQIHVNPCGSWQTGGPVADCGVTGRKIVVDQYGGYAPVGGGAFSGKDYSKVDRSAAYMCRYLAKNIVAAGICNNAIVEMSYEIGCSEPSSLHISMDDNQHLSDNLAEVIRNNIDLTPSGIIKRFDGSFPRNYHLTKYGHYGCLSNEDAWIKKYYPWELIDLKNAFSSKLY